MSKLIPLGLALLASSYFLAPPGLSILNPFAWAWAALTGGMNGLGSLALGTAGVACLLVGLLKKLR